MGVFDLQMFDEVRRMNLRQLLYQGLNFAMIVSSALMIWKGLMVVTGSESPIVVVLSGSMEPAFYRYVIFWCLILFLISAGEGDWNSLELSEGRQDGSAGPS